MQYDGIIAYDWDTGKVAWKYSAPNYPFETPFTNENGTTVSPFFTNAIIADGKIYSANGEHSPTSPLARGWDLHCINATTGEGIWNITGGGNPGAMADGYLIFDSRYDGYMYVFGKGKSATTVTASDKTIAKGESVMIEGTVLDQSPAQPGTPCVSKESMSTYMEYLHMQKTIPSGYTVTGVPVMLLAFDENGGVIDLGSTTSDASGRFAKVWTPENEGVYKITATFLGDDSYGSSWAETGVAVGPAPEPIEIPQQEVVTVDNTPTYFAVSTIAIILAIAVASVLILRKRA
jgi:outer membrane protein assembly factor BamB